MIGIRYLAVLFGGAMSGLGGAYLSLAYTPMWAEEMTAGRGWIALALVVFSAWRPWRLLLGAYLVLLAWRLRRDGTRRDAVVLFHYSLAYLALLFVAMALDPVLA